MSEQPIPKKDVSPFDDEDFLAWRDNPITKAMMQMLTRKRHELLAEWVSMSWHSNRCDPHFLERKRGEAEGYKFVCSMTNRDFINIHIDPLPEIKP